MSDVDIILPTYNCEKYIEETLDSIVSQSFQNWKLIIVDDASQDTSVKIITKYLSDRRIKLISLETNKGAGFCRNLGIRNSESEYIAFIDSDDLWEKDKLLKQIDFMKINKYNFTYTNYLTFSRANWCA